MIAGPSSGCNSSARRNRGAVVVEVLSEVNINGFIYQEDLHQVLLSFVCLLYSVFLSGAGPDHEFRIGRIKHERVKVFTIVFYIV